MHIGGVLVFDPLPDGTVPSLRGSVHRHRLAPDRASTLLPAALLGANGRADVATLAGGSPVRHPQPRAPCGAAGARRRRRDVRVGGGLLLTPPRSHAPAVGDGAGRGARARSLGAGHEDTPLPCRRRRLGRRDAFAVRRRAIPSPRRCPARRRMSRARCWPEHVPHPPDAVAELARTGARAAAAGVHAALHPREALERSRAVAELIVRDELIAAPRTSLNVPIGATRRFEIVRASLPELKAIAARARRLSQRRGAGGLHRPVCAACCSRVGEPPPPEGLRAMVPMNVRERLGAARARQPHQLAVRGAPGRRARRIRAPAQDRRAHDAG